MKIFIVSIVALLLVFGLVIGNYFLINNIYDRMLKEVNNLTEASVMEIDSLVKYWDKKRIIVSLSIPHRISDELERNLVVLEAKIKHESYSEFEEIRAFLINSIEEMKIHAGLSFDTVF